MLAREGVLAPRGGVAAPGPRRPEAGSPRKKLYLSASADRPAAPHAVTQHPVLLQVLLVSEFYVTIPHLSPRRNYRTHSLFSYKTKLNKTKTLSFELSGAGAFFQLSVLTFLFASLCVTLAA